MTQEKLTNEQIREKLCAPLATDSLEDIVFDEPDFDEEAERNFIRNWLAELNESSGKEAGA